VRRPSWVVEVDLPGGRTGLGPLIYTKKKEATEDADLIGGTVVPVEGVEI